MTYNIRLVQAAVHARLSADSTLQSLLGSPVRLYDHTPPATQYPFVRYGDQGAAALDTHSTSDLAISFTLEIYSRYRGRHELRTIEEAIYASLHMQTLNLAGGSTAQVTFASADQSLDGDGLTYRGRMRFRVLTNN
ncbi:MAG: DUF3168 domain-containing protein [Bdellovibrionales bacterium]